MCLQKEKEKYIGRLNNMWQNILKRKYGKRRKPRKKNRRQRRKPYLNEDQIKDKKLKGLWGALKRGNITREKFEEAKKEIEEEEE